jgi:hypothetical protein
VNRSCPARSGLAVSTGATSLQEALSCIENPTAERRSASRRTHKHEYTKSDSVAFRIHDSPSKQPPQLVRQTPFNTFSRPDVEIDPDETLLQLSCFVDEHAGEDVRVGPLLRMRCCVSCVFIIIVVHVIMFIVFPFFRYRRKL